ncbi:hypothetical protein N2152v2_007178 [Parachlorella kessleri]
MTTAVIEEEGESYVPIGQRPEWAGVAPRHLPALDPPVVSIARDQQFGDLMDYFWAAVEAGEVSDRVLALTEEIIVELNSANYTVWEWRWRCIQALGGMEVHAEAEEVLTRRVAHENPKNYQLWNHRRRCALARGPQHAEQELAFAAEALAFDAKNYHAWAHRQALLAAFGSSSSSANSSSSTSHGPATSSSLWESELAFTDRLLREDLRNNSAWNQRFFVLARGRLAGTQAELNGREVDFVVSKIHAAAHNESAWAYLRGLAGLVGAPEHAAAVDERWRRTCEEVLTRHPSCAPALSLLADVYAGQAAVLEQARLATGAQSGEAAQAIAVARQLSVKLLDRLVVADPLRAGYYQSKAANIKLQPQQPQHVI